MLAQISALRKEAECNFPQNIPTTLTFSTTFKIALDNTATIKDSDLIAFLTRAPSRQPTEWDALHFLIGPNLITPTHPGHNKILFRKTVISNIASAIQKQTAAKQRILKEGNTIHHAISDANLLILWDFLFGSAEAKTPNVYNVYNDHLSLQDMTFSYDDITSLPASHRADVESAQRPANSDSLADPHKPVLQRNYLRPYYVRDVDDVGVLQAWEGLMGECMVFLVKGWMGKELGAYACFRDVVVRGEGEEEKRLGFAVDVWYVDVSEQGGARGMFKKSGDDDAV